jgi:NAD(P)-dependent dehydrogenase (short-subunit alcohol dehydrogenase family)
MSKTILITGSTDGIGRLAAIKMAKAGHQLYMHGRNPNKLNMVIAEVKKDSGNDKIEGFVADFSDFKNVQKMSDEINKKMPYLDVLINNAGVFKSSQAITKAGIDTRIVVNYLAPYLLTNAIIGKLRDSPDSRIINLSSAAQSSVSLELLEGKISVSDQEAYAQSKLAILMWTFYLARRETNISVTALNPGSLLNTNMVKEAFGRFWSSADKGANIIYDLALSNDFKDSNGKYFDNDRESFGPAHPDAYDVDLVNALIEKTEYVINAGK